MNTYCDFRLTILLKYAISLQLGLSAFYLALCIDGSSLITIRYCADDGIREWPLQKRERYVLPERSQRPWVCNTQRSWKWESALETHSLGSRWDGVLGVPQKRFGSIPRSHNISDTVIGSTSAVSAFKKMLPKTSKPQKSPFKTFMQRLQKLPTT